MAAKKVLQVFGSLGMGGAETMMMNVLRNLNPEKYRFDFAVSGSEVGYYEAEAEKLGCHVYHMTKRSSSLVGHHLDLARIIRENGYQIVHFHTENAFLTSMELVAARLGGAKRLVVHSHNTMDWRGKKLVCMHRLFRGFVYHHADVRLSCGKEAALWLYGTSKNVKVIPIPVDCSQFLFSQEKYELLRKQQGVEGKRVYFHAGRFNDVKNHTFLIDIFREIKKLNPESVLLLAGSGVLQEEVRKQVTDYGLAQDVIFLGDISDVPQKMILADAFVFPSKYEGFPTVVLEAQASGLPCYISDNITSDIVLTDLVKQISLQKSAAEWAEQIVQDDVKKRHSRMESNQVVRERYDVSVAVRMLMEEYVPKAGAKRGETKL